ncbi:Uncharacterized membrane protein [Pseudobutyrivibrio sp. JW11]|uniref:ECF transporter S component n=1 Tax=Pseudobutyrivibrio sp. JW11 TaxID=1855302 RepID=UPI0008F3ED49|nr:ECF transporter S component [Pseudobutyrivibrio sp. JW11]SFO25048.1 Uncharacterized membrane protein [Pseudobutyrivibrio sp. JW11]
MSNTATKTTENTSERTRTLITAALFAALTCVGTMIIKIPTPTMGYIHPGDGFVLLSGLLLGPIWGTLAAGIGSALSDLIGGYFVYVPATFIIKALTALTAYLVFKLLRKVFSTKTELPQLIVSGIIGELVMVFGYFIFEIFMLAIANGTDLQAGVIASLAGIIPNLIQALFGVIICTIFYPVINKINNSQNK